MQGGTEMSQLKFSIEGNPAFYDKTFFSELGDVYISLHQDGRWINVAGKEIYRYIDDSDLKEKPNHSTDQSSN